MAEPAQAQEPQSASSLTSGILARMRRSRTWRVVSPLLGIVLVSASVFYLVQTLRTNLAEVQASWAQLRPWPLLVSATLTFLCILAGGLIWRLVLEGMGLRVTWRQAIASHLLANLGGYIPGYAWRHVGKAYLISHHGVDGASATLAVAVEFAALAITRAAIAILTLQPGILLAHDVAMSPGLLWALRGVACGALLAFPYLVERLAKHRRRYGAGRWPKVIVHKRYLGAALALMCASWIVYGLGFGATLSAIYPVGYTEYLSSVFASTASFLVSLILFFVPAGLTVREGVITLALAGVVPAGSAALAAIISRIVLIVGEACGAAAGLVVSRGSYVHHPKG